MDQFWIVKSGNDDETAITSRPDSGVVQITAYNYAECVEAFMEYDAAQLDTLIAALTEARRAIS